MKVFVVVAALAGVVDGLVPPSARSFLAAARAPRLPSATVGRPREDRVAPGGASPVRHMWQTGGGILGVGTPELVVICLVGWFILGPKELYKLAKEIGKVVASVRQSLSDAADEWRSTVDSEFEFEGLNDVKAAAAELQDAFNFRSQRYMSDYKVPKTPLAFDDEDPLLSPLSAVGSAAASYNNSTAVSQTNGTSSSFSSTAVSTTEASFLGGEKEVGEWNEKAGLPSTQLDIDGWNAAILAREAGKEKGEELAGLSSVVAAEQTHLDDQPDDLIEKKREALDRIQAAYERKKRELELEFAYEREKLAVELATSEAEIPSSPKI